MRIEVEGKVVEVDDSFANLPPDQQQAAVDEIANSLTVKEKSLAGKAAEFLDLEEGSPLFGGVVGATIAPFAGRVIEKSTKAAMGPKPSITPPPAPAPASGIPPEVAARGPNAVENWTKTQHAGQFHGGSDYAEAHQRALKVKDALAKTPGYAAVGETGIIAPQEAATQFQAKQAAAARRAMPIGQRIVERAPIVGTAQRALQGAGAAIPAWLGRGLAGGSAGFQGVDAANRLREGDILGSAISGLGALGSGAALIPHPLTRGLGTAISVGAPIINELIDRYRRPVQKASGGTIRGYANLGQVQKTGLDVLKKTFAPKPTNVVRASEALGPHEGKYLYVTESDRMRSTGGDLGGPGFSKFQLEDPRYAEAQAAWGVASKPKASAIININKRFPEDKVIWSPFIGSESQHRSNQHVYDMLTDEFSRQASLGKLSPELREAMNKRLSMFPKYAPAKLSGLDVANPETLKEMGNTFDRRAAIAEVLGGEGVGGRKGQIFDYPGIMQEMTDPMTLGAPTHSVGTRLFSLTGDVEHRPDLHSAFPFILKGEDKGVAFNPVPKELMLGDWIGQVKDFTGREPGYMEFMRGVKGGHGRPYQFLDEALLKKLEEAGHKKGGLM